MPLDVLEEHPLRAHQVDDPPDMRPQMALVSSPKPLARKTESLTGVSCREDVDSSPPRPPFERREVVPDRRGPDVAGVHGPLDEPLAEGVALDIADAMVSGLGKHDAELQSQPSGT